jgi:hypothetical protein
VPGRSIATLELAASAPLIDGRIDDDLWKQVTPISTFVQQRPLDGEPATERTDVWLSYDRSNLYVAVRARYSDLKLLRANRVDRDQIWQDDNLRLYLDPFSDQQRAYVFAVNPYGVQGDTLLAPGAGAGGRGGRGGVGGGGAGGGGRGRGPATNDPTQPPGDVSWNALFSSAGTLTEDGWTAELAIPFKSLRYPARAAGEVHRWGLQIQRTILGKNESAVWSPVSRAIQGFLRQLGQVDGMRDLSTSRNLELQPTVTTVGTSRRTDDSLSFETSRVAEAGLGVKYGITSNLTLDFTANPDFSQVESDRGQIETNQRFPLFVPEQRPFFVEGQENFNVQAPVVVLHTKTIVNPRFGAKVTGKLGRTLVGFMVADDEAPGQLDDSSAPGFGQSAKVIVARARQVLIGDSSVGVIATNRIFADTYSRLAGIDGQFRIGNTIRIRTVAMAATHRDIEGVENRGTTYQAQIERQGRSLIYGLSRAVVDPGFRTDLGFVRRTDTRATDASVEYAWWPESWVTTWGPRFRYERITDAAGTLQNTTASFGASAQFAANMTADLTINRDLERYEGIDFHPNRVIVGGSYDRSRYFSFRGQYSFGRAIRFVENPFLGTGNETSFTLNLRPLSRVRSEITLNTSRLVNPTTGGEEFDVRILRALSTYQFTGRFLVRNITEYDTSARTVGVNLLATYRVNAGTAAFVGYDDRFEGRLTLEDESTLPIPMRRANRALFAKLQLLLRY